MRLFILLILVVAVAAGAWLVLSPAGPSTEVFVEVTPGLSSRQIGALLQRQGIIRSKYAFDFERLIKNGKLKAGEYRFDHPVPVGEVYERIVRGDVYTIAVTIPEGSNLFDVAMKLEAQGLTNRTAFLKAAKTDVVLIADMAPKARSLEGFLFPDTYRFSRAVTADQVAAAMVKRFRSAAAQIGLTHNFVGIVTLASIVERESPISDERPLVASVFVNRIDRGMPLMTDPTVIYALLLDGRYRGTIYQSDLNYDSAYNTYRHAGMPPGPICNPGIESLKAAMEPAQSDYLYFVAANANGTGRSKFAKTLLEHEQNVEAYRRAVRQAGGR